jgi:hypothetical protein
MEAMKVTHKKLGIGATVVVAGSMLLVPALRSNAGSLPDPETVPCEAFGSDADCLSQQARRKAPPRCGVVVTSSADVEADHAVVLTDLIAHANLL